MHPFKRAAAALAAALSLSADAATSTTDYSDLWFIPTEEGWGANIVQQRDVLFITLFVYGPDNKPAWYVGPATALLGVVEGSVIFQGPLFATTGPWFGAPTFDESAVASEPVGEVRFSTAQISNGTLSYSVHNTTVTKAVQRQTWRAEVLAGVYVGATLAHYSGCGAGQDGYRESNATYTVTHGGLSNITVREDTPAYTCTYSGAYSQAGRMGQIQANGTCTDGRTPTLLATEVQAGIESLTMRYSNTYGGGCSAIGRMGGLRRAG